MIAKYDAEAASMKAEQRAAITRKTQQQNQDELLKGVVDTIKTLACSDAWHDTFYRNNLDSVIVKPDNILEIRLQ